MGALIVIPARYASSRYPGKPLVGLRGATGKSMSLIERSWRAAMSVGGDHRVVVATDDDRIAQASEDFGAEVVMTSSTCRNGTERCAEAADILSAPDRIVVNLQGDAPLTPPWFVEDLIAAMEADPNIAVATPVLRCDADAHRSFVEDRLAGRVGGTTAVFDNSGRALYFSKEVIPYTGRFFEPDEQTPVFHHVGVYAYDRAALSQYPAWDEGRLEVLEGLEQLRFVERGHRVQCVEVDGRGRAFWELNNPEDISRIEAKLTEMGVE